MTPESKAQLQQIKAAVEQLEKLQGEDTTAVAAAQSEPASDLSSDDIEKVVKMLKGMSSGEEDPNKSVVKADDKKDDEEDAEKAVGKSQNGTTANDTAEDVVDDVPETAAENIADVIKSLLKKSQSKPVNKSVSADYNKVMEKTVSAMIKQTEVMKSQDAKIKTLEKGIFKTDAATGDFDVFLTYREQHL